MGHICNFYTNYVICSLLFRFMQSTKLRFWRRLTQPRHDCRLPNRPTDELTTRAEVSAGQQGRRRPVDAAAKFMRYCILEVQD